MTMELAPAAPIKLGLPNGTLIEYLVDAMGRRVGKKVNGVLTKQWLYRDTLKPVAELDGSGALVAQFVYGSKGNVPDYVQRGGVTYRFVSDHLGSPRYVVNVANSGDVPFTASYSAFGSVTGTGLDWMPFGFAGGTYDPDTGLVRFGARDYDPLVGRWTSKDPIRFGARRRSNFYEYAGGDPVNRVDRTGNDYTITETGKPCEEFSVNSCFTECQSFYPEPNWFENICLDITGKTEEYDIARKTRILQCQNICLKTDLYCVTPDYEDEDWTGAPCLDDECVATNSP